jgi:hypothetical protein
MIIQQGLIPDDQGVFDDPDANLPIIIIAGDRPLLEILCGTTPPPAVVRNQSSWPCENPLDYHLGDINTEQA